MSGHVDVHSAEPFYLSAEASRKQGEQDSWKKLDWTCASFVTERDINVFGYAILYLRLQGKATFGE